jgi:hypothetical protein
MRIDTEKAGSSLSIGSLACLMCVVFLVALLLVIMYSVSTAMADPKHLDTTSATQDIDVWSRLVATGVYSSYIPFVSRPLGSCEIPADRVTLPGARIRYSYQEIVPCLDTPEKVRDFMYHNLEWDGTWDIDHYGGNAYSPAWEVYANGVDDCDGLAVFAACVLSQHGFEAYNYGISVNTDFGHNVAGFVGKDGMKYSINNGVEIDGPFETWEALAQYYIDLGTYAKPDEALILFAPCIDQVYDGYTILQIPHQVLRDWER